MCGEIERNRGTANWDGITMRNYLINYSYISDLSCNHQRSEAFAVSPSQKQVFVTALSYDSLHLKLISVFDCREQFRHRKVRFK